MVNQPEIVDYIKNNPYSCERDIMYNIYGFTRGGGGCNKKYAECLRRALRSGKIMRVKANVVWNKSTFFYYTPNFKSSQIGEFRTIVKPTPTKTITESFVDHKMKQVEEKGNGEDILLNELVEEAKQRGIIAGAKFRLIQGKVGEVNKKDISNNFHMNNGRLMVRNLDDDHNYTVFNNGEWVEVIEPKSINKPNPNQIHDLVSNTFEMTVNMKCLAEYNSIKLTQIAEISFSQYRNEIQTDIIYLTDTNVTCMGKPVKYFNQLKRDLGEQLDIDFTEIFDELFEHNFKFILRPEIDELKLEKNSLISSYHKIWLMGEKMLY
jgi:hypothetical protein